MWRGDGRNVVRDFSRRGAVCSRDVESDLRCLSPCETPPRRTTGWPTEVVDYLARLLRLRRTGAYRPARTLMPKMFQTQLVHLRAKPDKMPTHSPITLPTMRSFFRLSAAVLTHTVFTTAFLHAAPLEPVLLWPNGAPGALGDKDFLYKQRVWFMKSHDNVCANCSTGCPYSWTCCTRYGFIITPLFATALYKVSIWSGEILISYPTDIQGREYLVNLLSVVVLI